LPAQFVIHTVALHHRGFVSLLIGVCSLAGFVGVVFLLVHVLVQAQVFVLLIVGFGLGRLIGVGALGLLFGQGTRFHQGRVFFQFLLYTCFQGCGGYL